MRVRTNFTLSLLCLIILSLYLLSNLSLSNTQAAGTVIYIDPSEVLGQGRGSSFSVNINIADVQDLYSWEVILSWDKEILEVTNVVEGPFLSQGGQYTTYFVKKIYNDKGFVRIDCTIMGGDATTNADGSGTLATITFTVKTPGTTTLHFNQTLLLTYYIEQIEHTSTDGLFYTYYPAAKFYYYPANPSPGEIVTFNASSSNPNEGYITSYTWNFGDGNTTSTSSPLITHIYSQEGTYNVTLTVLDSEGLTDTTWETITVSVQVTHDIAVISIVVSSHSVYYGSKVSVNVTVENQGGSMEMFNLTVYANATIIYVEEFNLSAGENATLSLLWDTSECEMNKNYTIAAYADIVNGEVDVEDNSLVDGTVWVKMPGDIDGNGKVDYKDLFTLAASYGTKVGDDGFNASCDFNNDGKVDYKDLFTLAANYGSKA